jgi:hypothetical protein
MSFLLLLPTILSWLAFCAHLLRNGFLVAVPFVLPLLLLLFVKHGLVARIFQLLLMFIAVQWLLVGAIRAAHRADAGEPWLRMLLILAGVAVLAFLSAACFEAPRLQRRYPRRFAF